jgi:Ca2+-dependent lipid-binding protein
MFVYHLILQTPKLKGFIDDSIASVLSYYVEPHKNIIDIQGMFDGSSADFVYGLLRVTIYEAKDLKNQELAGRSDPYAQLCIGGKPVAKTTTIDGSLNPFWGETYYIPIMKSTLEYSSDSILPGAPKPDDLHLQLFDYNDHLTHKSMGKTPMLGLARWVKLLEGHHQSRGDATPASTPVASGTPGLAPNAKAGDEHLDEKEREHLITEWGTPFDEPNDVWKDLFLEGDPKARGQVRIDMSYFPFPKPKTAADAPQPAADAAASPTDGTPGSEEKKPLDAEAKKKAEEEAAARKQEEEEAEKKRQEALLKCRTGVLTIGVHQAKELPCTKNAACKVDISISGVSRPPTSPDPHVGETHVAHKTNNPVWESFVRFYVEDTDTASCLFDLKDTRDNTLLGQLDIKVKDVINLVSGFFFFEDFNIL